MSATNNPEPTEVATSRFLTASYDKAYFLEKTFLFDYFFEIFVMCLTTSTHNLLFQLEFYVPLNQDDHWHNLEE